MNASVTDDLKKENGSFFLRVIKFAGSIPLVMLLGAGAVLAGNLDGLLQPGHPGWQEKSFVGQTCYTVDGGLLHAVSQGAASGLFHEQKIDLKATPWLNWSWKAGHVLQGLNEREKKGDDYPARIYVVAKGGLAFWKTRALSYVWSASEPVGTIWPNAFTSNAAMIAVESGADRTGELIFEKRNIRADWKAAFGEDIDHLDAVAIMTDTDNSGQTAEAWYGRVWFSER